MVNAVLIDFGVITPDDTSCVVDRQKIRRAKLKFRQQVGALHTNNAETIQGFYFDGKEIDTLTNISVDCHRKNVIVKQEHTVIISEPGGEYLGHVTTNDKKARTICEALVDFLSSRDAIPDVQVIGADSTVTNTGANAGIIRRFEDERGSRVHWSICLLHTNELPLRHLIEKLDGETSGHNSFKGIIGKSLMEVDKWKWNTNFCSIKKGPNLPTFTDEVFKSLSADQRYLYLAAASIKSGKIESRLLHLTAGPVNHSRWLTTACRLMTAYLKKNPFKGKAKRALYSIVFFVVTNYVPCWFAIKIRPLICDASHHVLLSVELLRLLPKATRDVVAPYVKSWHAHPENLLVSLLCSEDITHRSFAVDKILELRGENDFGNASPRVFNPPELNLKAKSLVDLIQWEEISVTESALTCCLSKNEIERLRNSRLTLPSFPSHTQGVERVIRELTAVCGKVAGTEARDGYIRVQCAKTTTKRDFNLVSNYLTL